MLLRCVKMSVLDGAGLSRPLKRYKNIVQNQAAASRGGLSFVI